MNEVWGAYENMTLKVIYEDHLDNVEDIFTNLTRTSRQ